MKWITLAFITAIAISCGGGGSGGSDDNSDPAFRYNGETGQAVITEDNAEKLVMGCYSSFQTGSVATPPGSSPGAAIDGDVDIEWNVHVFNLMRSNAKEISPDPIAKSAAPEAARTVDKVEYGSCGGSLSVSLTINESNGNFSGSFDYHEYCDKDVVVTGPGKINGHYDLTGPRPRVVQIRMSFASLAFESSGASKDLAGWFDVTFDSEGTETADMDIHLRDDTTDKIYWLHNYTAVYTRGPGYDDVVLTGKYYDPEFGYVDLSTADPIRLDPDYDWPLRGHAELAGKDAAKIDATFDADGFCTMEVDIDGDGQHDIQKDIEFDVPEDDNHPPVTHTGELSFSVFGAG
jgi:hypothetical protein